MMIPSQCTTPTETLLMHCTMTKCLTLVRELLRVVEWDFGDTLGLECEKMICRDVEFTQCFTLEPHT